MTEEKMYQIAHDCIRLPTVQEIIKKNKISKDTFYELKKDPDFKALLIEARAEMWESVIDDVMRNSKKAIQAITSILKDPKTPPSVRLKASKAILDYGAEYYDNVRILSRIEELEEWKEADWSEEY